MSRENVNAVNVLFAAFANRDLVAADSVLDSEVEIRPGLVGGLEGTVYRGLSGNEQFWTNIDAVWMGSASSPTSFETSVTECSSWGKRSLAGARAVSPSTNRLRGSLSFAAGRSSSSRASSIKGRPSKPPGCGSRPEAVKPRRTRSRSARSTPSLR